MLDCSADEIFEPNLWMLDRPGRRMPSAEAVAAHWAEGATFPQVYLSRPACLRCAAERTHWHHLERAHLINRQFGGLDVSANIAMLCRACHRRMPNFHPGQECEALLWAGASVGLEFISPPSDSYITVPEGAAGLARCTIGGLPLVVADRWL